VKKAFNRCRSCRQLYHWFGTGRLCLSRRQQRLQTFFAFTCLTTKNCSAQVLIDSSGAEKTAVGNPLCEQEANSAAILAAIQGPVPAGTPTIGAVLGSPNVTPTDFSGTVAVGGTAQNTIAANATIHGFTLYHQQHVWFRRAAMVFICRNGNGRNGRLLSAGGTDSNEVCWLVVLDHAAWIWFKSYRLGPPPAATNIPVHHGEH
jgi:hypothetical protein